MDPTDGISVFDQLLIILNSNEARDFQSKMLKSGVCSVKSDLHTKNLTKYWKPLIHGNYVRQQPNSGEQVTFSLEKLVNQKIHR